MKNESCLNCMYAFNVTPAGNGSAKLNLVCRRDPPQTHIVMVPDQASAIVAGRAQPSFQPQLIAHHPPVAPDSWCGEWDSEETAES